MGGFVAFGCLISRWVTSLPTDLSHTRDPAVRHSQSRTGVHGYRHCDTGKREIARRVTPFQGSIGKNARFPGARCPGLMSFTPAGCVFAEVLTVVCRLSVPTGDGIRVQATSYWQTDDSQPGHPDDRKRAVPHPRWLRGALSCGKPHRG